MWILVYPIAVVIPMANAVFRQVDLPWREYLRALAASVSGVVVMALAVWGARSALPAEWPRAVRLGLQVGAGALAYSASLLTLHRGRVRALIAGVRAARA